MRNFYLCILSILMLGMFSQAQAQLISINDDIESWTKTNYGNTIELPDGWSIYNATNSKGFKVGRDSNFGTKNAHSPKQYISISTANANGWSEPPVVRDEWLVTPQLKYASGAVFSFWGRSKAKGDVSKPDMDERSNIKIMLSKTGNDKTDFTVELKSIEKASIDYTEYSVDLSDPAFGLSPDDLVYIAIKCYDDEVVNKPAGAQQRIFYLDDIFFGTATPVAELSNNSWTTTCIFGENITSKSLELKNAGKGNLTVKSIADLSGTPFSTSFVASDVNLASGEKYQFTFTYDAATEGNQTTDFVITTGNDEKLTISLDGTSVKEPEFVNTINEGFENGLPLFWSFIDNNADDRSWKITTFSADLLSGKKTLSIEQGKGAQDDWLITPKVLIGKNFHLDFVTKSAIWRRLDKVNIKASVTGKNVNTDFTIDIATNVEVPSDKTTLSYNLTEIAGINEGDKIHIAIQCISPEGRYPSGILLIDDIVVEEKEVVIPAVTEVSEDFEAGLPTDWTFIDKNEDSRTWQVSGAAINVIAGSKTLVLQQGAGNQNDWMISPKVKIGNNYELSILAQSGMSSKLDHINIMASVSGKDIDKDFTINIASDVEVPEDATTLKYDLTSIVGIDIDSEVYIAIQCVSPEATGMFTGRLLIDDIKIKEKTIPAVSEVSEDFETGLPTNWFYVDKNADGRTWKKSIVAVDAISGNKSITLEQGQDHSQNDWLITPKVKLGADYALSFKAKSKFDTKKDIINIKVSKTGKDIDNDFTISIADDVNVPGDVTSYNYDLTALANLSEGDEVYIAIQCVSPKSADFLVGKLALDDIKVASKNAAAEIVSCSFTGQISSTVDADNSKVTVIVPSDNDLSKIEPTFVLSTGASISPEGVQDFSAGSIEYTVTAENGTTKKWTVEVKKQYVASSDAEITALTIKEVPTANVLIKAAEGKIIVDVPAGTNLSALTPIITVSVKATVLPASDVVQDFSAGSVSYTVKAEDNTEKIWTVTVTEKIAVVDEIHEGFESKTIPADWTVLNEDNDKRTWVTIKYQPFKGEYIAKTKFDSGKKDDWLITPRVKVDAEDLLTFMYRSSSVDYKEDFEILASKTGKAAADFTIKIDEIKEAFALGLDFAKYSKKLSEVDGINAGDELYIAIRVITNDGGELHVDEFSVAPAPTDPEAEIDRDHWRSVSQVDKSQSSGEIFNLKNILAGELNVTSIELPEGYSTSLVAEDVELAVDETYRFEVNFSPKRTGDHNGTMVIHTNGGDINIDLKGYAFAATQYHEGFEEEHSYRNWDNRDVDADGNQWFPFKNYEYAPDLAHSGQHCVVSESALLAGGPAVPNNWLITPRLVVGNNDKLVFWVGAVSDISFKEKFTVKLSSTNKEVPSFSVNLVENRELTTNEWTKVEVDLSKYAGQNVYIAFLHTGVTNESQLLLDDVVMPALYMAAVPDLSVRMKKFEYTQMPLSQASFKVNAIVRNNGNELTDATNLEYTVEGNSFNENIAIPVPLGYEKEVELDSKTAFVPTEAGSYKLMLNANLANDDNPKDNVVSQTVKVDTVLAKDNGVHNNYVGTVTALSGVVGQVFEVFNADTLTSISFYRVKDAKAMSVSASVYAFNETPGDLLLKSQEIEIASGQEGWMTIQLDESIILEKGKYVIGLNEKAGDYLKLGVDMTMYTEKNTWIYLNDKWQESIAIDKRMTMTLLLRANFGHLKDADLYLKMNQFEYSMMPRYQVNFKPSAMVKNSGKTLKAASNVEFSVEGTSYSETVALPNPFVHANKVDAVAGNAFKPTKDGKYTIKANAIYANDLRPSNNMASQEVRIDSVYARDRNFDGMLMNVDPTKDGMAGQVFELFNDDELTSLSFYRGLNENAVNVKASVYKFTDKPGEQITITEEVELPANFSGWFTIRFPSPVKMKAGKFMVAISKKADDILKIGVDPTSYSENTCWINAEDTWTEAVALNPVLKMAMLMRPNFGVVKTTTGVDEFEVSDQITVYPNPANDFIKITGIESAEVTFYNLLGNAVKTILVEDGSEEINVSDLKAGIYMVKIVSEGKSGLLKVMITK